MALLYKKLFKNVNLLKGIATTHVGNFESIRNVSYIGSPFLEDVGEVNVKYRITKDPVDWLYVERALPPLLVPQPTEKPVYPSGWKPQSIDLKDRPYFIDRTKNHMLPVYLDISFRGTRRHTLVRKISGNIFLLEKELREFLQPESPSPLRVQVNEFTGVIRMNGDFVNACKYWLEKKGY